MAGKKGQSHIKSKELSKKFPEYYKANNPNWTDEQCEAAAKHFRKTTNWQCIEYYEEKYPELSHEEHLILKDKINSKRKSNNPLNIEYYKVNFPNASEEEIKHMHYKYTSENNYQHIAYYQKRYPDATPEEQEKMRLMAVKNASSKYIRYGEANGNHHSNTTEEQRRKASPKCIEHYEALYPELSHEEHLNMLHDHYDYTRNKVKNAIKTTNIEYYINQGMSLKEAKQALKERQTTFTLEKCIEKYGKEEGTRRFNERQEKWKHSLQENFIKNGDGRSVQSNSAKILISKICCILNLEFPKREKYITDIIYDTHYAFDFTYNKKMIEINGNYWHCNPEMYDKDFYNKSKGKYAWEIWEYDKHKIECAKMYGYDVLIIWENECLNDCLDETVKKCIKFLTS